ncbi:MAG TPA: hypothetical protein VEJ18_10620 [Planctomycetota bacterium]|nr:hypothetical protein [Planctomycetota bacterium]
MEVVVDGRAGLTTPETGTTFRTLFEQIRRSAALKRRVVVSLTLDGETLSAEREGTLAGQPPTGFALLEVRTVDPVQLSLETLGGLQGHVANMIRTHDEAAEASEKGEYARALEKFDAVFHGWDILLRAVRDVGALSGADFRQLTAGDGPVENRIRQLQDALLRFSAALEFKDVPRITEIVKQELRSALDHWKEVVAALTRHVGRLSGAAP